MASKFQPWTEFIVTRVAEGPVSYTQLLTESAALVPPGRGFRQALSMLTRHRGIDGDLGRNYSDPEHIKDKRIKYGQRNIASKAIRDLLARQRLEEFDVDGTLMVRKGPRELGDLPDFVSARTAVYTHALLRAVRDGPVLAEDAIEATLPFIARDKAIHKARQNRERSAVQRGYVNRIGRDDERDFRVGARQYVQPSLASLVQSNRLVMLGKGRDALISKGPRWHDPDAGQ